MYNNKHSAQDQKRIMDAIHSQHSSYMKGDVDAIKVTLQDGTEAILYSACDARYHKGENCIRKKVAKEENLWYFYREL